MTFADLNIIDPLLRALDQEGYTSPTPIQMLAIPHLLKGRDLMGIAQTGTGKTAAFVLPILQKMHEEQKAPRPGAPRALVLAPTRELAAQIDQSFATYGRFLPFRHTAIFGGVAQGPQVRALSRGVDILVATPGRLLDLMNQGHIKLSGVEFFVLDEIDRMLDMGFVNDVRKIVSGLPKRRHSQFFSATLSPQTDELARRLLTDPVHVEAAPQASTLECIEQSVFLVDQNMKYPLLQGLLEKGELSRVLVFTRTKHRADKVAKMLNNGGIRADAIHGNKSQNQRTVTMRNFKSGRLRVMVATDIAARGIDVDGISHVVNYDLPREPESYVHRIGRTGRAGAMGAAYSFCGTDEQSLLRQIEKLVGTHIEVAQHRYGTTKAERAAGQSARQIPNGSGVAPRNPAPRNKSGSGPRRPYPARVAST
ncbi:MAG TPA: DEAD/DEAH box helicase [Methanotrichaceae archaeon]|nr:MAG: putative ATP-dependent RNA helicase [Methanosaeta sp. PtaU1.Bin028]HOT06190.1 DEAD/DEAH box helicase [Methanotrichaceae archaeon]HQF15501.1 DEAD/DEAH box helicase [Methanotrichaceae archaeon]HQI90236.1 DEAD/DEAH box helicase [Methanotrichaceae archaeon]HQJ27795.1 DEAD/DEAH box helicase [Methanotrichaceae archaeon]